MKEIVIALAAIIVAAAPTMASVDITLTQVGDTNEIIISYDATSEAPNLVRAFALNIQLHNDAKILEVTGISSDYYIFPGTIQIDSQGNVTDFGTALADYNDLPGDTLPGLDSNGITIEMASLYAPVGPGSPNAPAKTGDLLSIRISKDTCLGITANVPRAGATGVVMEDPNEEPTVVLPVVFCTLVCCHPPVCWDNVNECAGQGFGDATCDGAVNLGDLIALKAAWGQSAPWTPPFCCADFDHSGAVNLGDLVALKAGWGVSGYSPSTNNQNCP
jgi:hypothetical protein